MKRGFSTIELVLVIGIASLVSSIAIPRIHPTIKLMQYRSSMRQVAGELRVMRYRAINEKSTFSLRVDPVLGRVQMVSIHPDPTPSEKIESTFWMPEGLEIIEAPDHITIFPSGDVTPATILAKIDDPGHIFRIVISPRGMVRMTEKPTT